MKIIYDLKTKDYPVAYFINDYSVGSIELLESETETKHFYTLSSLGEYLDKQYGNIPGYEEGYTRIWKEKSRTLKSHAHNEWYETLIEIFVPNMNGLVDIGISKDRNMGNLFRISTKSNTRYCKGTEEVKGICSRLFNAESLNIERLIERTTK